LEPNAANSSGFCLCLGLPLRKELFNGCPSRYARRGCVTLTGNAGAKTAELLGLKPNRANSGSFSLLCVLPARKQLLHRDVGAGKGAPASETGVDAAELLRLKPHGANCCCLSLGFSLPLGEKLFHESALGIA
jgi:hypothetical protein